MCEQVSRRAACRVAAVISFAIAWPTTGTAQDLARLAARVASADRATSDAHDSLLRVVNELRLAAVPNDSIVAGAITLRFSTKDFEPAMRDAIQRAANEAWRRTERTLGDGAERVGRRLPIIVTQHHESPSPLAPGARVLDFGLPRATMRGRALRVPFTEVSAVDAIGDVLSTVASLDEPAALKAYAGQWVPAGTTSTGDWSSAEIDLATSTASVARDCFEGSVTRCESALGLTEVRDSLAEWYAATDWRAIVSRIPPALLDSPERKVQRNACLHQGDTAACGTLVREQHVPYPLTTLTRRTVIDLALELGGAKAYDHLTAARGSALQILATTAGVGGDDLVAEWRRRVLAATPQRVRPSALEATAMIAWTMLFAFGSPRRRP